VPQLIAGVWALGFSRSFYEDFPFGQGWVSRLGPFNEHLIVDVGALFCALAVLALFGAARVERRLAQATGLTWIVFLGPHLYWHSTHTEGLSFFDNSVQLGLLVVQLVIAVYVVSASRRLKG
jgi:hypothetical protein